MEMTEEILEDNPWIIWPEDELSVQSNGHSESIKSSVSGSQPEIRYVLG